jgi:prepilin-type N-terminal cleavage/methylation domain-containing protein
MTRRLAAKNKRLKNRKAFTLVEILTVVLLGSLIIMAAYTVYLASYKSYKKNTESSELTQNARIALERMSREIRQAQDIIDPLSMPPSADSPTQNIIVFQDGHTIFSTPSPDPTCSIQYIEYTISNGNLTRTIIQYKDPLQSNMCVKYDPLNPQLITYRLPLEIKAEKLKTLKFWGTNSLITIYIEDTDNQSTYQFETQTSPRN